MMVATVSDDQGHVDRHHDEAGSCLCACPECVGPWRSMLFGGARRCCICPDCPGGDCPNWRLDRELYDLVTARSAPA